MHGRLKGSGAAANEDAQISALLAATEQFEVARSTSLHLTLPAKALEATTTLLQLNTEQYSAWNYRRICLEALDHEAALMADLQLTSQLLKQHPKSYWLFNHRKWLLERLANDDTWKAELFLCSRLLDMDARNFHCWDHRRWILLKCGVVLSTPAQEFQFSYDKIAQNFSNYSAWHYRSKLLEVNPALLDLKQEFDTVHSAIFTEPADQSAWLYYRWLLSQHGVSVDLLKVFFVRRDTLVSVHFLLSEPCKVDEGSPLKIDLESGSGYWRNSDCNKDLFSRHWIYNCLGVNLQDSIDLKLLPNLFLKENGQSLQLSQSLTLKGTFQIFGVPYLLELSPVSVISVGADKMNSHIETVQELLSVEPDSKYALIFLAEHEVQVSNYTKSLEYWARLLKLDTLRRGYYNYVMLKIRQFECEDIESLALLRRSSELRVLPGLDELALRGSLDLMQLESLDLSVTKLKSMKFLSALPLLKHANLSQNSIEKVEGLVLLDRLESLDLSDNRLRLEGLHQLKWKSRPSFKVNLNGNRFTDDQVEQLFPFLKLASEDWFTSGHDTDFWIMDMAVRESWKCDKTEKAYNVGAVIYNETKGVVESTGYSRELEGNTHAEECAIEKLQSRDVKPGDILTLVTTMEPCGMRLSGKESCSSRLSNMNPRVKRIVYATREPLTFVDNSSNLDKLEAANFEVRQLALFDQFRSL